MSVFETPFGKGGRGRILKILVRKVSPDPSLPMRGKPSRFLFVDIAQKLFNNEITSMVVFSE